jgi:DNA transposition AAA+ family ATPase
MGIRSSDDRQATDAGIFSPGRRESRVARYLHGRQSKIHWNEAELRQATEHRPVHVGRDRQPAQFVDL